MTKDPLQPTTKILAAGFLAGIAAIFFWVPTEAFQGVSQRILYLHAPSAWVAYLAFGVVLVCSVAYLKTEEIRWDWVAHASAKVGVLFTGITLITGAMWGRPIWGAFWAWDPRLTLTLVLFLIYLGYLTFRANAGDETRGARIGAVIGIAGFLVVPLVHFSVDWWRGQHPARTVIRPEAEAAAPPEMQAVLLGMFVVFTLLYLVLLALGVRVMKLEHEVMDLEASFLENTVITPRTAG
jgi:heme exporter protein C